MARRLSACAPPRSTVARVGGDEFVLLVPGVDEPALRVLTHQVMRATSEPWHFNGNEFRVNGSVGVALYPEHGPDPEALLKNADARCTWRRVGAARCLLMTSCGDQLTERVPRQLRAAIR